MAELLGSDNTLDIASDLTVRPFDLIKISLVSKDHPVVPLEGLLVGESLGMAVNTDKYIRLDADAADLAVQDAPLPYSDPLLADPKVLGTLIRALDSRGLIVWRTSRRGKVGVFCVAKKCAVTKLLTKLRLIFDCRQSGALCQEPPTTTLSTAGAFANTKLPSPADSAGAQRPY